MNTLKVTCISENTTQPHSFLASHGQSLLLEIDIKKYIFDTGEIYEGFIYNSENLHLDLTTVESVILSHNHLDHSGALFKLIDQLTTQKLLLPPDMMTLKEEKYNLRYRVTNREDSIKRLLEYQNTIIVNESMQLSENLYTTGSLNAEVKEQSLVITIPGKGIVILVGCSHPTLPVIIEKAKEITRTDHVYGIIGGLHYKDSTDEEITEYVTYIKSLNPEFVVPSHCTGYKAIRVMQEVLNEKIHVSSVGQFGSGNSVTILPELLFNL